jgi:hypothetical protein
MFNIPSPFWFLLPYPKPPCTPLKSTLVEPTCPLIEISSYKELPRDGHTTNKSIQLLLELPLNAPIETYLRGVSTNNIKSPMSNKQQSLYTDFE